MNVKEVEKKLDNIEKRNKKVEFDKAWETSFARRTLILVFTYVAMGIYLGVINVSKPWLNAIVPAVAFMLSTLTMPIFKSWWIKKIKK